jgi:D-arginine dehydrogenase
MDIYDFDIIVIGAGIAGASSAAHLAADYRVALLEAEEAAGYHSTGRSAAVWILNYGPPDVRVLTGLSRPFFEAPPPGFCETPLMSRRPVAFVASPEQEAHLRAMLDEGLGLREASPHEVQELVPALHQGFLRQLRARGGVLKLRSRTGRIERQGAAWEVEVTGGAVFRAPIVVNASGAWGDEVARQAGVRPVGLRPKRRTAVIIDPAPWDVANWPLINDVDHTWYARPEARTKLLVSPADETDMLPHDVQPDEMDIAIAIDRMQQALDIEVRRVERSWAGLRSFTPDGSLAIDWDGTAEGFFWLIGQGGYGIQTSPAAGKFVADMVAGRDPGEAARILHRVDPRRFDGRASTG